MSVSVIQTAKFADSTLNKLIYNVQGQQQSDWLVRQFNFLFFAINNRRILRLNLIIVLSANRIVKYLSKT